MEIELTQSKIATVSPEDFDLVSTYKWHAARHRDIWYAASKPNGKVIYMHRLIMGITEQGREICVDHIDYNGLNNTRENLRACTQQENLRRRRSQKTYLGLRGVSKTGKGAATFRAQILKEGKLIFLGSYETEREAGIAYYAASVALFGVFAAESPYGKHE